MDKAPQIAIYGHFIWAYSEFDEATQTWTVVIRNNPPYSEQLKLMAVDFAVWLKGTEPTFEKYDEFLKTLRTEASSQMQDKEIHR